MSQASPAGDAAGSSTDTLSRDDVFDVLSNRRRRYMLHYLQQNGEVASLGEVAEKVAAWENGTAVEDVTSDQRKRVYTSLQQFHLPKMDEHGVVEFDRRAGAIELSEAAGDVDIYLEVIDEYDVPWSYYYLGLTAVGTLLVGLSILGIEPLASIPEGSWIAFLLVTFGVSAVVHTVVSRGMRLGTDGPPPDVRR